MFKFSRNVVYIVPEQLEKTAHQNNFPFWRYLSSKLAFSIKIAKNGVQRSAHIPRTVNARKSLIWYLETTRNSLPQSSHQFFHSCSSSGCNFHLKMANFDLKNRRFWGVLKISNLSTCPPEVKLRIEAAHIRLERMQKTAGQNYSYFWLNSMSKIAKIAKLPPKILWMIQKIFEIIFLPQEFF